MSITRLKWNGAKSFEDAEWELWHRKNDVKQVGPLTFARVFGRGYNFWAGSMVECTRFINEYVLGVQKYGDDYESETKTKKNKPVNDVIKKSKNIEKKMVHLEDESNK